MKITGVQSRRNGKPLLLRLPELNFNDDQAGIPTAIQHQFGRRSFLACGNSDRDFDMLEWPQSALACVGLLAHHTDTERE